MNFMAFKVDHNSIKSAKKGDGKIFHAGAEFDPLRRKMAVPLV